MTRALTLFTSFALAANFLVATPGNAGSEDGGADHPGLAQLLGHAASSNDLDDYRGGQALSIGNIDAVFNELNVNGEANGNSAAGNTTGNNAVNNDAFANASGLTTLIQNTGNNVLIQSATILNFTLE